MPGTAIFDMDRTLTKSGTWSRYLFQVNAGRPAFYLRLPLLAVHAIAYKLGFFSRRSVKEHGLKTLTWASEEALKRAAEAFAEEEVRSGLRRNVEAVLRAHRAAGDRLVMATAAAELVAKPIGEKLGMDLVICTDLEWTPERRLSGKIAGENCYGAEKLNRLKQVDAGQPFARPVTGYSDHVSDAPFLSWADRGVAVNPSSGLERIAAESGFTIEDWDRPPNNEQESKTGAR